MRRHYHGDLLPVILNERLTTEAGERSLRVYRLVSRMTVGRANLILLAVLELVCGTPAFVPHRTHTRARKEELRGGSHQ